MMKNYVEIESYRKVTFIFILVLFGGGCFFAVYQSIIMSIDEKEVLLVLIGVIPLIYLYFSVSYFVKLIKNYNTIFYIKNNGTNFHYLHIPSLHSNSRGANLSKIKAIYIKPEYFTKGFQNIVSFGINHKNQITMLLDTKEERTLPIFFSPNKLNEVLNALNAWLDLYHKNKTLN